IGSDTVNAARKYARLYGPELPPLEKSKCTRQKMSKIKESQFIDFFLDKNNVTISSYKVDSKSNLPVLYMKDQKKAFIHIYYHEDLSGLCQTCNDYDYEAFSDLKGLARRIFTNKKIGGNDIIKAGQNLAGISFANIEPDHGQIGEENAEKKVLVKTIPEISKYYYWEWPTEGPLVSYICTQLLSYIGSWENYLPAAVTNLCNTEIIRLKSSFSEHTENLID
ncbi:2250_t:CDS:2, partial [Ambispora leptoticha]